MNIIGFQQLIISYGFESLNFLAPFIVLAEILIGCLLLLNIQVRIVSIFSIILLIIFTFAYTYAWKINGITDCGCFGTFNSLSMSPTFTYIRNICLLLISVSLVWQPDKQNEVAHWKLVTLITTMFSAAFISGMSYRPMAFTYRPHPYENKCIKDTQLEQYINANSNESILLFFFSYQCPHCISSMENLKFWKTSGRVDNLIAYAVIDTTNIETDSLRSVFLDYYSDLVVTEINKDFVNEIDAFPTTFYVENDTIKKVLIGSLPSPILR